MLIDLFQNVDIRNVDVEQTKCWRITKEMLTKSKGNVDRFKMLIFENMPKNIHIGFSFVELIANNTVVQTVLKMEQQFVKKYI